MSYHLVKKTARRIWRDVEQSCSPEQPNITDTFDERTNGKPAKFCQSVAKLLVDRDGWLYNELRPKT